MHVAPFCAGCNGAIFDRYFLSVSAAGAEQQVWHCTCLKCAVCGVNLDPGGQGPERTVCFYKDGQLLCRDDYFRRYRDGAPRNCTLCQRGISSAELVMKLAGGQWIYHVECFRCGVCGQPLRTGDQFALRPDGHVVCRAHHPLPPPPHPVPVIHYADSAENLSHAPLEQYTAAAGQREPLDLQILREMAASGRSLPMLEPRSPKPTYMTLGDNPEPKMADKKRTRVRGPRRRRSSATSQFEMLAEPEHPERMGHAPFGGREVRRPRRSASVTSSASTELSPPCGGDDEPEPGCSPPGMLSLSYMQGGRGMQLPPLHMQRDSSSPNSASGPHQHHTGSASQRTKRMRTSFKHQQLRTMKQYFGINHNPDAKDLKQLAQKTGLSKRVLQVWFQNARAKYRRSLLKQDGGAGTSLSSGCAGDDSPPPHPDSGHMSLSPESLLHGEHPDASSPLGGDHYPGVPVTSAMHYY